MFDRMRHHVCHFVVLVGVLNALPALAQNASPIPVEQFFQPRTFTGALMSPDGRNIALQIADKGGSVMLLVTPVEVMKPRLLIKTASDVSDVRWVNNNRLVFSFSDHDIGQGDMQVAGGLFAINIDGSGMRELVTRQAALGREAASTVVPPLPYNTGINSSLGQQDSDNIYVNQFKVDNDNEYTVDLLRLNTVTGRSQVITRPGRTVGWILDEKGEPRITFTAEGKTRTTWYKDPATDAWRVLFSSDTRQTSHISAHSFGPDGVLYVLARNGRDKTSLYTYDIKNARLSAEPVVTMEEYDFNGSLAFKQNKVSGVRFETDAPGTLWLDEKSKQTQAAIDALLPGTTNRMSYGRRSETPYALVIATSDTEPGAFYLYNTSTGKIALLGRTMPNIDPKQMAEKEMIRYKARDGLPIPAYVTVPNVAVKKNLPMVVLVHGGPWVRGGHWNWDPQSQFLASRGYVVFEPEYRGSTGFGDKHYKASFKQWGLKMQDDVADGVRWAIAKGLVDPKRICIAGASYGGYATMMGLLNDPDLYQCGVNWVGVTDINLMYTVHWSDFNESYKTYGMPVLVGDQKRDAAQLKATSPLENAARIKQPVILAYGGADRRVPKIHGTMLRDAMQATNPNVEWIEYAEEGHGWHLLKNNIDFWTRVEKFLDKNIGPNAPKKASVLVNPVP